MKTGINSEIVKKYGADAGADVVGIAAAASGGFQLAPDGFKPSDVLEECLSVIVLGSASPREVLSNIGDYTANRNEMLTKMTDMAKVVAKQIKRDGYNVKEISGGGGKWMDDGTGKKEQFGYISLKHAAELAGLGVIGKNYLLTNPEYGNLLWLSAVLTDADLIPDLVADLTPDLTLDKKKLHDMCENCNICVESCPSGALSDSAKFGRKGCSQFFKIVSKKFEIQCFTCRTACPHCFGTRG
jgi:epoxyqueuosine reductase QueG